MRAFAQIRKFSVLINRYFVAFKVTADTKAPPAGSKLCGDLGPIVLAFPAPQLVVPARIAAAASSPYSFGWRFFVLAAQQMQTTTNGVTPQLRYSGEVTAAQLAAAPQLSKLAAKGDRLTKLDVEFYPGSLSGDIDLIADPAQADFRQTITEYVYVPCDGGIAVSDAGLPVVNEAGAPVVPKVMESGGCNVGGTGAESASILLGLALALGLARRRRR